jgi:hypothetical protein
LEFFKNTYDNKAFTLIHCWKELRGAPKWEASYDAFKKGGGASYKGANDSSVIDIEEDEGNNGGPSKVSRAARPKGHKASKADLLCDASSLALQETLKGMITEKDEANAKRDELLGQKKEEMIASFIDLKKSSPN